MRFTNAAPDIEGLHVTGNASSPGGILILGPPSNGRLVSTVLYGYTNGTALMAEGLTAWQVEAVAGYCYRGFGFGAYCDGSEMRLRADRCTFSVDTGVTNALWQYGTQGPVGGKWTIVGNYNGDCVLTPARGVLEVNVAFESCTNAFVSLGHNLARHGYDNTAQGAGTLMLNLAGGFGNPANGGVVPANWTNAPIELNCIGNIVGRGQIYGTGWTNGWFISRNAQADTASIQWEGRFSAFDMRVFMQLSTGERVLARNIAQKNQINQGMRILQTDPTINANYDFPLLTALAKFGSSATDVLKLGYAQDISGTNFAGGLRMYYSGGPQAQFTNVGVNIFRSSPSANQVLLQLGTSDDADRFSVDEDGDVNVDGNISGGSVTVGGTISANGAISAGGALAAGTNSAHATNQFQVAVSNNQKAFNVGTDGRVYLTGYTLANHIRPFSGGSLALGGNGDGAAYFSFTTGSEFVSDGGSINPATHLTGGTIGTSTNAWLRGHFGALALPQLTAVPTDSIVASAANNTPWTMWNQTNIGPVLGKTNSTSAAGGLTIRPIATDSEYLAQLTEEFFGGGNASFQMGELGWRNISGGNGTPGAIASEANHPGIYRASTAGSANSYSGFALSQSPTQSGLILTDGDMAATFIFRPSSTNNTDIAVGFAPPATHFIATASPNTLAWNTANICVVSTNGSPWYLHARNAAGGPESWTTTGVVSQSAAWVKAKFRWDSANSTMYLSVNNSAEVSISGASLPSLGNIRCPVFQIITADTTARDIDVDFFWAKQVVTR